MEEAHLKDGKVLKDKKRPIGRFPDLREKLAGVNP